MRSVAGDLTTQARIRDVAIEGFPKDGFAGTAVRAIAAAAAIFGDFVDDVTVQLVEGQENGPISEYHGDPHQQAAVLVAMQLGGLLLHGHLTQAFGVNMLTAEGSMAAAPYTLQALSGDLFDKEIMAQTKQAIEQLQPTGDTEQRATR